MLWQRLSELWESPLINKGKGDPRTKINDFRDLLLFPTRNKARNTNHVLHSEKWPYSARIVPSDGTYQSQSNFANRWSNPLYDYVAEQYNKWPQHRVNTTTRRGWTHHGLRHFAVSWRLQTGTPLPLIASEVGHKNSAFTLQRYGHVMTQDLDTRGYEF